MFMSDHVSEWITKITTVHVAFHAYSNLPVSGKECTLQVEDCLQTLTNLRLSICHIIYVHVCLCSEQCIFENDTTIKKF